jgi:hypothetical protein
MDITHTLAYKKAFNAYLRRGTPIEWSLKAMAWKPWAGTPGK